MKKILKQFIPHKIFLKYHSVVAYLACLFYNFPSKEIVLIGITGTKGKTTTANFLWSILEGAGMKTGLIGTANIRIGEEEYMNEYHMTMPKPWVIQKLLRKMVMNGCTHVVMEVTSEGLKLNRDIGLYFDVAIFTNLTPEHLPSHGGSFEKYKEVKAKLFASLSKYSKKILNGKEIKKVIITNADDEHYSYYHNFDADKKITYGISNGEVQAQNIYQDIRGVDVTVLNNRYHIPILGTFNVYNVLPGIALANYLEIRNEKIQTGISSLTVIPGRMEIVRLNDPATIIVDYAHEKVSMNGLLDTAKSIKAPTQKIVVILGAEGGGRDKAKREHMGRAAGLKADYVVVTNVDPYEDEPGEIIEGVAKFAEIEGKIRGETLFTIENRRKAIEKAIRIASVGDIVLVTGKGSEQSMIIGGKMIPWDDRKVIREILETKSYAI